jgi:hypothetical protein
VLCIKYITKFFIVVPFRSLWRMLLYGYGRTLQVKIKDSVQVDKLSMLHHIGKASYRCWKTDNLLPWGGY